MVLTGGPPSQNSTTPRPIKFPWKNQEKSTMVSYIGHDRPQNQKKLRAALQGNIGVWYETIQNAYLRETNNIVTTLELFKFLHLKFNWSSSMIYPPIRDYLYKSTIKKLHSLPCYKQFQSAMEKNGKLHQLETNRDKINSSKANKVR